MATRRSSSSSSRANASASAPARPAASSANASTLSPFAVIVLALVVLFGAYLGITQWIEGRRATVAEEARPIDAEDMSALVGRVSRHIVVNGDEDPTVATVQDADLLRSQSPFFYKDAKNGDRLLVWSDKAVLYSPERDILLAVLPVSLPAATSTASGSMEQATSTAPLETATIEVRNGSTIAGRGRAMATKLNAAGFTALPATDAKVKNYAKTAIVKTSDKELPETLKKLQETLNASVIETPTAEAPFKGDFLVIVGADFQP